ncbi:hypothetical protein D030_0414A, partial [Vibrio parahaemolyticus AQ3810]
MSASKNLIRDRFRFNDL